MINKKKCALLVGFIGVLSSACLAKYIESIKFKKTETIAEVSNELGTFSSNKYKQYTPIIKEFSLGKKVFENIIDIDMKGLIAYPKEKQNSPILIVLAGNENLVKEENGHRKNLYKGYKYLAEGLAECGFLAVVIDTQFKDSYLNDEIVEDKILEELFDYHVEHLGKAVEDKTSIYGIDLYKKGDINKLGLIGQSSTARNIFNICNRKYKANDSRIKGLLSITPGESLSVSNAYPDIPISILVAEHSVNTKIGFDIYNEIEKRTNRNSFASLTYLVGGDSSKFNEKIEEDKILEATVEEKNKIAESKMLRAASITQGNSDNFNDDLMSQTQSSENILNEQKMLMKENTDLIVDTSLHENFLSSYCVSFFKTIFEEDEEFKKIFSGLKSSPSKLYGVNVLNKYYSGPKKVLYSGDTNTFVKHFKFDIENVVESSLKEVDTAINFNEPTTVIKLNLKKLKWDNEDAQITVSTKNVDFSKYNAINVRWAIDSSSVLNVLPQKTAVITLKDLNGNKSSVILGSENALRKIDGREKFSEDGLVNWSRYTPLSDTRIPISVFNNINIEKIKSITLSFNNVSSGSVYLEDISLVK